MGMKVQSKLGNYAELDNPPPPSQRGELGLHSPRLGATYQSSCGDTIAKAMEQKDPVVGEDVSNANGGHKHEFLRVKICPRVELWALIW
eukprot:1140026-Pelagomonas_calceolata.AAC.11